MWSECIMGGSHHVWRKTLFYKNCTLVSLLFVFFYYTACHFIFFFLFLMWHMEGTLILLSKRSGHKGKLHHVLYCLLLIYTLKKKKKRMYFSSQSQMLYLIQLCLFISLKGFNRWKLGSSVSNKLDKQTKNPCRVFLTLSLIQKCCLFISTLKKKKKQRLVSEINLYFHMYESALSDYFSL